MLLPWWLNPLILMGVGVVLHLLILRLTGFWMRVAALLGVITCILMLVALAVRYPLEEVWVGMAFFGMLMCVDGYLLFAPAHKTTHERVMEEVPPVRARTGEVITLREAARKQRRSR